jgi:hypothetical protein
MKLGITLEEFYSKKLISSKPLESPESQYFFNYIKIGDEENVLKLLKINRYLVYEFDNVKYSNSVQTNWITLGIQA